MSGQYSDREFLKTNFEQSSTGFKSFNTDADALLFAVLVQRLPYLR
jgi:hypothetical protein